MHGEDVDTENTFVTERFFSLYYLRVIAVARVLRPFNDVLPVAWVRHGPGICFAKG